MSGHPPMAPEPTFGHPRRMTAMEWTSCHHRHLKAMDRICGHHRYMKATEMTADVPPEAGSLFGFPFVEPNTNQSPIVKARMVSHKCDPRPANCFALEPEWSFCTRQSLRCPDFQTCPSRSHWNCRSLDGSRHALRPGYPASKPWNRQTCAIRPPHRRISAMHRLQPNRSRPRGPQPAQSNY